MIEAVVFDLDGVLVDSEPVWEQVRRGLVAEHGGRWPPDAQTRLMGMSTSEWSQYLGDELGVGLPPESVATIVIDRMAEHYADSLPLIPGAAEAVARLASRWPLALASSSPRRLIDVVLDSAGLRAMFATTVSTDEVGRGKPAPDVYVAATERLRVGATSTAAVEDSTNGIRAAVAAGLHTIAVPRPDHPLDPPVLARASVVLDTVDELTVALVDSLGRDQHWARPHLPRCPHL